MVWYREMKKEVLRIMIVSAVFAVLYSLPVFGSDRLESFSGMIQDIDAEALSPEESQTDESLFDADEDELFMLESGTGRQDIQEKNSQVKNKASSNDETAAKEKTARKEKAVVKEKSAIKEKAPSKQKTAAKQKVSKKQSKETAALDKKPKTEEKTVEFKNKTQKISLDKLHITAGATTRMEREVTVIPVRKRVNKAQEPENEEPETDSLSEYADLNEDYEDEGIDAMGEEPDDGSELIGYEDGNNPLDAIYGRDPFFDAESDEERLEAFAELVN